MSFRPRLKAHPLLAVLGLSVLAALAAVTGAVWFIRGDEVRLGRSLSWILSQYLDRPILIERVKTDGHSYIELRGIRVPPGKYWGGALEIRELRVEGGILPVVFPRGRTVSVVAVSTSVILAKETAPLTPPAPDTLTSIRSAVLRFLDWPAVVSLEMKGGELRSGNATLSFDLRGEKSGDGKLVLRLDLRGAGDPPTLTIEAVGAAIGRDVRFTVHAQGDLGRLGPFWPPPLPALGRITAAVDLALSPTPELDVTGTLTTSPTSAGSSEPLTAGFAARYRPRVKRVDLSRLVLERGPALQLDLTGSAEELDKAPRLMIKAAGTVDKSRLTGDAIYSGIAGELTAKLELRPFVAGPLLEHFGYARPAFEITARSARLTLQGRAHGNDRARVEGTLGLEGVKSPPSLTRAPIRAVLRFGGILSRRDGRVSLATLDTGELSLASPTADIGSVTTRTQARSGRTAGPWPLAVEARIPDLSRLPPLETVPLTLSGDARAEGTIDWTDSGPRFAGQLTAYVLKGEVDVGGPLVISDLRVSLPLAWGGKEEAPAGTITAESLSAFGLALRQIGSPARMRGSTLSLPEITYLHYGGSGKGYAEAELAGAAVPLRARLEGEGVDLTKLTTEYGLTVGRITGKIRYLLVAQYAQARGLVAVGQVASDPPGGEVNIDALKKLLSYAEGDPTGILRRTLESLSVFSYDSLTGNIRIGPQGGRVSLSLEGKKRLGLFPGRVRAINFENVPLSLLAKTFGQPRRDSP
jgi:hypothetical protein